MKRKITIIFLLAFSFGLYAQEANTLKKVAQRMDTGKKNIQKADTVKKVRILKEWNLSSDYSEEISRPIDTTFNLFHRNHLADKYSSFNATLGNYGLPFYQINFFDRVTDPDQFLYSAYYPFMFVPDKAVFMNTQVPYTELDWSYSSPKERSEQTFRVRHSQNINRNLNFGLILDVIYSMGQYNYQRSEDKTFTFHSSYTGDKYKMYFAAGINNITSYENGGVMNKNDLSLYDPNKIRDIPVNLGSMNNASSMLKNRNLLLVQRYTLGGKQNVINKIVDSIPKQKSGLKGTFSHIFIIERNGRDYSDSYSGSGFYDTIYLNNDVTFDSLASRSIKNTVRFDFATDESRKFRLGGGVGLRNEMFRYMQIIPTHFTIYTDTMVLGLGTGFRNDMLSYPQIGSTLDTLYAGTTVWKKSNNVLVGRLYNSIGDKFKWIATGELYLSGYRAGDFNLDGEISKSFDLKKGRASWLLTGSIANRQPSFWYEQWGGNHFVWHNNFLKEFRIDVGSTISYPARNTEIKFNYAVIDNYTDFNTEAEPSQHSGGVSVAALTLKNEMKAWKFHLSNEVLIQKSTNEIISLPLVTVRSAGYFEHLFLFKQTGGKLNTQLGVDVTYHTLYHPYSYMPVTGRFYRQDQSETGNYPFINVFVNIKLKRTRIFIMFDHINSGYMGYNYEMIPSYPMNIRMLRYGLAWTFYN